MAAGSKVTFELTYEELLKRHKGRYEMYLKVQPKQLVRHFEVISHSFTPAWNHTGPWGRAVGSGWEKEGHISELSRGLICKSLYWLRRFGSSTMALATATGSQGEEVFSP